jgi:hypothetical protein
MEDEMSSTDDLTALKAGVDKLPANDQGFAQSLIAQATKRGSLTEKQWYWVGKLAERLKAPEKDTAPVTQLADLSRVLAMFDHARKHLKYPQIVLGWKDENDHVQEVKLYVAGAQANVPGSVNVKDAITRQWYGRIRQDGRFEHSMKSPPPRRLVQLLQAFAKDPEAVAAEHGKLSGKCCFCNSTLTDERSTAVGYGPVCAKHFGLAWGAKKAQLVCD